MLQNIKEIEPSANILLKLSLDSNNFYANCKNYKTEDKEKENNLNDSVNWGEMSWFIVKMLKTSQGENVNLFSFKINRNNSSLKRTLYINI